MDKKSSMSRIERQKREKVLRFSIRKYSFGAASVAVAALMFLGARVVSADSVTPVDQPHVEALTQDTSPLASQDKEEPASSVKVDTAVASQLVTQLKDQLHVKEAANTDLLVAAKEELVKAEQTLADSKVSQEEVDALVARLTNVLDQLRAVETPQVKEDKNGESTQEATPEIKPEVAKPTPEISAKSEETSENTNAEQLEKAKASLKLSIERLEQTIAQTPENELTREILEKAIAQVAVAKSAFGGVEVSLRDVEDMNRVIKRNESSVMIARNRLTSGSHDPRNGQSMGEGTQFRAYTATSSSGALKNVRYFASVDKRTNGGRDTKNDDPEFTEKKTVIKAKYEQNSSGKWMVYDVYFNNNGVAMADKSYSQHYYFQPPFNIMDGSNRVENLTFTRYRNVDQNPNRKLSDGDGKFQKVGETAVISNPWEQKTKIFPGDRRATYDPQGVSRPNQKWQVFKNNQNDQYLDKIVKRTDGSYTGGVSYTLGLEVGKEDLDYAIHMTARVKLKDNVTETEAGNGNVYAASVTTGRTTNQSYIVGSQGTSLQADPDAPKDPIKGLTVTKTVGDDAGDPINPVSSGYVKHGKNGTFPAGMNWTWKDNKSPSTAEAGVFKYKSIATYKDGSSSEDKNSGSDGTVTLNVKPKQPTIETSVENKKGLPNQQITVNVGNGVPDGSTVKLYDGDRVIGTGVTKGQTATVTVAEALPGNPIKAETVVTNANGTVTSDKSNPVTPTEVPDNQPPTLEISPANQTVVEGQTVTFTVTARDDKHVNFDPSDLTTKYSSRLITGNVSATPVTETDTEKTRRITITTTAEDVGKTNTITFKATDNAGHEAKPVTFTFNVTPRDTTPPKIYWLKDDGTRQELGYTHAAGQNVVIPLYRGDAVNTRLITVDDSGKVTDFRLENLQSGFNFTPVSGTATEESPLGQNVTGKVGLEVKKGKYTARAISTDGTNSTTGYFVFDIHEQAEKYPLEGKTETVTVGDSLKTWNGRVDSNQYTEAPKGRGVGVEWGWKGEAPKVVQDTAGVFKYTATATHPDKSVAESNPQVTIIVKPKAPTIETDLTGKAEVPNTEVVVNVHDGVKDGSTVTLYSPEGRAIGTGTVTNGKAKITGTIPVGNITAKTTVQTPGQPNVESELSPIKVATKIAETEKPGKIEITQQPNGNAIVTPKKPDGSTYPPKTTVEIPGENGTPIKVTIGDNGSGEVPNDKLPKKDVPGTGTVTEPNKKPSQPVDVTTPARKTPTIELKPDPKTGDVTVTPQRPGGGTYPPGTKVEIPGEDGPITVTIGEDGKGKVPNDNLPKKDVPGTGKITEPGKPAVEVPNVTTPAKVTPETPETEKPGKIEITQQPNGNAIVTPKKPDGSTYPSGSKVEIPGENGTTITVTIGDNGSGEVPNDNLPKKDVPGTGTVTEPNKKPSQPVDVTTPARKTPTVELEQDPKTGDVTVTPKKPDGSTYPPGTKVEIPGKDGNPITVTIGEGGKGKVPNSELPEGKVPGTAKIIEPGQPAVEVPDVTTPGKVTPSTPTDTNPVAPVTPDMPVKPDTNGDSGQDKPAPATPTPNTDQVDTKTTVDNGAKSNDSQNVLPNTGTESNATLASLGLLGMLGGLGLAFEKKKED